MHQSTANCRMARSACLLAIGLFLVAQPALSKPADATPDFSQLLKEFQTSIEKSMSEVKKNLNLPENPDGAAIVKAIHDQQDKAGKAFTDMKAKIDEYVKTTPEMKNLFDDMNKKFEEAKDKLKKENPEVHANAQKVADTVKSTYESIGKEMEKIHSEVNKKGGIRDDLDNLLKNLIDRGTAAAKDFRTKVEAAVKESNAKKA